MKNFLKSAIFISMLGWGATVEAGPSVTDLIKTVMSSPKDFCGKGSGTSHITIRSGKGKLCESIAVAVLASRACGNNPDFWPSHCGKNITKTTGMNASNYREKGKELVKKLKGSDLKDFNSLIKNKKGLEAANPEAAKDIEEIADAAPAA